jgi:metallo-beta-lactamase class B
MEPALFASFIVAAALQTASLHAAIPADGAALARACEGKDGWSDPAPPARIFGNTYYVGTCGISAILITGPRGHILIDGATEQAAPGIAANIERLGFRISDVKLILGSHEHNDHAGGIAALQRLSGATVAARTPALAALRSGRAQPGDPQYGSVNPFPGVRVGRVLRDREVVRLGPLALTAHATPGHTPGSTSWTLRACEGRTCLNIVYADSLTALGADGYRFSAHPAFRSSLVRVSLLPCDVLVTPHPGASRLFERFATGRLEDRDACRAYAGRFIQHLETRLGVEERGR